MQTVEIVLVGLSEMLAGIVRDTLEFERDLAVVDELPDAGRLGETLQRTQAKVVIWGIDSERSSEPSDYFRHQHHQPEILGVEADGRRGVLWSLQPVRTPLGELSPSSLVTHVRHAATSRR